MVEVAQVKAHTAPIQRLEDTVAGKFAYGVMGLSAATFAFLALEFSRSCGGGGGRGRVCVCVCMRMLLIGNLQEPYTPGAITSGLRGPPDTYTTHTYTYTYTYTYTPLLLLPPKPLPDLSPLLPRHTNIRF
ncbi:hypothetical protein Vafri_18707 [Volvox africanus]|uniref:Uncharacterized protein n=1 Tax=Volvox africanus TaxID=51714 RepID=A0A8J4BPU6_9CHLO|nr:hypothetical protein Vafri_18707 [Volvox africanus]